MRLLHTMIRVGDLDKSIAFYTEALGMELLRKHDYPEGKFTLAFLGFGDEDSTSVIELTHNWDTTSYDLGNGFGHIAIGAPDIVGACGGVYGNHERSHIDQRRHRDGCSVISSGVDLDARSPWAQNRLPAYLSDRPL